MCNRLSYQVTRSPLVLEPADNAAWLDSPVSATAPFATPEKLTLDVELAATV